MADDDLYLIYNLRDKTKGFNDGCMVFWGPDRCGYWNYIEAAGKYMKAEAERITRNEPELKMISVADAMKAAKTRTYLWFQDLPIVAAEVI